jgi:transcriptional regulator with XRE-family HTH domain
MKITKKKKTTRQKITWTPEDRARHAAIREKFRNWHPGIEELVATGEYEGPIRHGAYLDFLAAMHGLRQERERQGLTLAQVSKASGLDQAVLSRLETGEQGNPTMHTILRYLDALGKKLVWTFAEKDVKPRTKAAMAVEPQDNAVKEKQLWELGYMPTAAFDKWESSTGRQKSAYLKKNGISPRDIKWASGDWEHSGQNIERYLAILVKAGLVSTIPLPGGSDASDN